MASPIRLGAVAYDPKAVTIWELARGYFRARPVPLDFVLFSNYEAQVDALFDGFIEIAWNTPVAWVKAKARSHGVARSLAMRDTDVGFTSKLIARTDSGIAGPTDLKSKTVAIGSRDSAQAAILPLHFFAEAGVIEGRDYKGLHFDLDVGKHGDTGTSELEVVKAVSDGRAQAGAVGDATWAKLLAEKGVDTGRVKAVWTSPPFDHCNFTALPALHEDRAKAFVDGLLTMDYADPMIRQLMELEGLKRWLPGRTEGYAELEIAMRANGMIA